MPGQLLIGTTQPRHPQDPVSVAASGLLWILRLTATDPLHPPTPPVEGDERTVEPRASSDDSEHGAKNTLHPPRSHAPFPSTDPTAWVRTAGPTPTYLGVSSLSQISLHPNSRESSPSKRYHNSPPHLCSTIKAGHYTMDRIVYRAMGRRRGW